MYIVFMGGHRHTIRMNGYDYSTPGYYFVTICTHEREYWFDEMIIKTIVENEWKLIPIKFTNVDLDEFVVMPNHIHGIVIIQSNPVVGVSFMKPDNGTTLGKIIRYFKAKCAFELHKAGMNQYIWQRNYFERIIRNERELNYVRQYIQNNPQNWETDKENLTNQNRV